MHGMDIRETITMRYKVEGCSIRSLSREHGMSRKTIRKILAEGGRIPEYTRKKERSSPVTGPFLEIVETWLKGDLNAPAKQRHTAKRIYRRLVDEYGFKGAESTIRKVVARLRGKIGPARESYVPLSASPGEQAQVDWGEAAIRMDGEERKVHLFCMRLRSSGTCFVRAYPGEKLEDFLDGHRSAFEYFGGVPGECWYDNLKTAVTKILSGPKRIEHEHFSALKAHYLFYAHFCGAKKGNEKGSVENLVGYVGRNALVPVEEYRDLESLNDHLLDWCDGERRRKGEKWNREREALRPPPAVAFDCSRATVAKVGPDNLVRYDRNAYSVRTATEERTSRYAHRGTASEYRATASFWPSTSAAGKRDETSWTSSTMFRCSSTRAAPYGTRPWCGNSEVRGRRRGFSSTNVPKAIANSRPSCCC